MKIHEYQAKQLLAKFGVPVPRGEMVESAADARAVAEKFDEASIEITSMAALKGSLLSSDSSERLEAAKSVERALEIASTLKTGAILVHPGQLSVQGTYQQAWDNLVGTLKDLVPVAERCQVAIGLENVWNKFLLNSRILEN